MQLLNNKIILSTNEFKQLSDKISYYSELHEQDFNNYIQLLDKLNEYKKQLKIIGKDLKNKKAIIRRNRKYLEKIIDDLILPIYDEKRLQEYAGLTYDKVKKEMLKYYDKGDDNEKVL